MSVLSLYLPVCLSVLFLYLSECLFPFQTSAQPFVSIRNGLKVAFSSISPDLGKNIWREKSWARFQLWSRSGPSCSSTNKRYLGRSQRELSQLFFAIQGLARELFVNEIRRNGVFSLLKYILPIWSKLFNPPTTTFYSHLQETGCSIWPHQEQDNIKMLLYRTTHCLDGGSRLYQHLEMELSSAQSKTQQCFWSKITVNCVELLCSNQMECVDKISI